MNQTTEIVKEQKEKVLLGAIGAFLFALAGGVMWYLLYKVGFLVGISGAVAVIAAMRGYTDFAKVRSIKGLVISVVMAVIVLVLAWYMCLATDVYEAFLAGYESGELDHKIPFLTAFLSASGFLQDKDIAFITERKAAIKEGYKSLWTENGYKSEDVKKPDDRANALAVLAGLAEKEQYPVIQSVLLNVQNSSPYMEYYVLEALCKMGEYDAAEFRIKERYEGMVNEDYSTLWEFWNSWQGTKNHAWSGGPLVIMSKHLAGIAPAEAGYERVKIDPQYNLSDSLSCTVPSVKGLITLSYEKTDEGYNVNVTLPDDMKADIYVTEGAVVTVNAELVYENGRYVNKTADVKITEKSLPIER